MTNKEVIKICRKAAMYERINKAIDHEFAIEIVNMVAQHGDDIASLIDQNSVNQNIAEIGRITGAW